jgi:hypothetical protein
MWRAIASCDQTDQNIAARILYPNLTSFMRLFTIAVLSLVTATSARSQQHVAKTSRADTLRGSFTTAGRSWWDVAFYDLHVAIRPNDSTVAGYNAITYTVLQPATEMQIDLMEPLVVDSMTQDRRPVRFRREGAAFFARLTAPQLAGQRKTITVYYHGKPQIAKNPPWQGGFSWARDSLGPTSVRHEQPALSVHSRYFAASSRRPWASYSLTSAALANRRLARAYRDG